MLVGRPRHSLSYLCITQTHRNYLFHHLTTTRWFSSEPTGRLSCPARWPHRRQKWLSIGSFRQQRWLWTERTSPLTSWRVSPSTDPGLITPAPCIAWPAWGAWGRALPSTCSSTSTVGAKITEAPPCWPMQVNYCWVWVSIWSIIHLCFIRPHGSSSSANPGFCRLSGCGTEPACQLLCGGGAGCGGGVHLGIPRTVGKAPTPTICMLISFQLTCYHLREMLTTAAPGDLFYCKLILCLCKWLIFQVALDCVLPSRFIF